MGARFDSGSQPEQMRCSEAKQGGGDETASDCSCTRVDFTEACAPALIDAGIYAEATVSLERQDLAKRYVVGGASRAARTRRSDATLRLPTRTGDSWRSYIRWIRLDSTGYTRSLWLPYWCGSRCFVRGGRERSLETRVLFDGADGISTLNSGSEIGRSPGRVCRNFIHAGVKQRRSPKAFARWSWQQQKP